MGDFHTSTAFHPDYADTVDGDLPLRIPESAAPWHSGMLGLQETQFERRFQTPGVYDYFCQPHYQFGMVGRLIVDEPAGGPGTRPPTDLPSPVRENIPDIERIMGPGGRGFEWASRLNGILYLLANDVPESEIQQSARATRTAMGSDATLEDHLGPEEAERCFSAADAFLEGVMAGVGYEELVSRADAVKAILA